MWLVQAKGLLQIHMGQYQITGLATDGDYTMRFTGLGYKTTEHKISVKNGASLHLFLPISKKNLLNLNEVIITPKINYQVPSWL